MFMIGFLRMERLLQKLLGIVHYDFLEKLLSLVDTENFLVGIVKKISITQKEHLYFLQVEVEDDFAVGYEWYMRVRHITSKDCFIKESLNMCTIQVGVEM